MVKAPVDVAVPGAQRETWLFEHQAEGHSALTAALASLDLARVVPGATGGDQTELACALPAAGLAVAVVRPRPARDFATSMNRPIGPTAKTDAVDARMRAEFAAVRLRGDDRARCLRPLADPPQP